LVADVPRGELQHGLLLRDAACHDRLGQNAEPRAWRESPEREKPGRGGREKMEAAAARVVAPRRTRRSRDPLSREAQILHQPRGRAVLALNAVRGALDPVAAILDRADPAPGVRRGLV